MGQSLHAGANEVYGPAELSLLSTAFDAALNEVAALGETVEGWSALEVRRRLASCVLFAARSGERDPIGLKNAALAGLKDGARPGAGVQTA